MKREIKFRGKRIDNGEWVYGDLLISPMATRIVKGFGLVTSDQYTHDGLTHCVGEFYAVDPKTVGQLPGLHDKNGKEIYEGDVVTPFSKAWKCEVKWHDGGFRVTPHGEYELFAKRAGTCEVIGNIHDNPELLK